MATQTITKLIDDLDDTVEADESIDFGLDGRRYEIDLSAEHAEQLRDTLAPYVAAARRAGGGGGGGRRVAKPEGDVRTPITRDEAAAIREWVRANGGHIGDRGRIPRKFVDAYHRRDTSIFDKGEDEDERQPETDEQLDDAEDEFDEDEFDDDDEDEQREPEAAGVGGGGGVGDPFSTFTEPEQGVHF